MNNCQKYLESNLDIQHRFRQWLGAERSYCLHQLWLTVERYIETNVGITMIICQNTLNVVISGLSFSTGLDNGLVPEGDKPRSIPSITYNCVIYCNKIYIIIINFPNALKVAILCLDMQYWFTQWLDAERRRQATAYTHYGLVHTCIYILCLDLATVYIHYGSVNTCI